MMWGILLNKLLLLLFIISLLNVIRNGYYFIQAWIKSNTDNPTRYILNDKSLLILAISLSYVLTCLFSGLFINF